MFLIIIFVFFPNFDDEDSNEDEEPTEDEEWTFDNSIEDNSNLFLYLILLNLFFQFMNYVVICFASKFKSGWLICTPNSPFSMDSAITYIF